MTIWYRAMLREIEPIEVESVTEHFVVPKGQRRDKKLTDWRSYFPTWDEAHAWLMENAEQKLFSARVMLQQAQDIHGNIKGMKRPTENGEGDV